jgi:autotransporter passenger strand-loop-strand repeat protein
VASNTTINSGGTQDVLAGGTAYDTTVNSAGLQYIDGATKGYAYSTTVNSGATQEVAFGGTAVDTLVRGGTQQVDSGGTAISTTITSGGVDDILAGGSASYTSVSSGTVIVDGTASDLALGAGALVTGTGTVTTDLSFTSGSTLQANTLGTGLHISGTLDLRERLHVQCDGQCRWTQRCNRGGRQCGDRVRFDPDADGRRRLVLGWYDVQDPHLDRHGKRQLQYCERRFRLPDTGSQLYGRRDQRRA